MAIYQKDGDFLNVAAEDGAISLSVGGARVGYGITLTPNEAREVLGLVEREIGAARTQLHEAEVAAIASDL